MNVHVSASRFRFQMFFDAICAFLPLLPNASERAIGFDVFVYFDGDGLRSRNPVTTQKKSIIRY
jgi:hypothetical protein